MDLVLIALALAGTLVLAAVFALRRREAPIRFKEKELGEFTRQQVALHNRRDDLWLILKLDGLLKVFDVTSYVDEHPGGDAILSNAGGDSTDLFTGPQHPPRVYDLIDEFCIGTVVEDTSASREA
jgi:cytochrome b involved in lipid metabolism